MKTILLVGLMAAAAANASAAQDQLNAAKDLYASAAYEEALSTLARLSESGTNAPAVAREVDEYRAFCLYALGRVAEAESMAEAVIRREPLAELNAADVSPRLAAMFTTVRKRVLPGLVRDQYRAVRAMLDAKDYASAEPRLAEIRLMLNSAERLGALDEGLSDLGVLVDGFLTLSRAQVTERSRPVEPATPTATSSSAAPAAAPVPPPAANEPPRERAFYGIEDADVKPPIAVIQFAPAVPQELLSVMRVQRRQMLLILNIDEAGNVMKADVRGSINANYDEILVRAALTWKYRPATRNGVPVRFEKIVAVDVK
jgi:tetratricopeptide (TPR) repeat protein